MGESVSKWEIGDSSDDESGVFADTPVHPDNKMSGIQSFVGINQIPPDRSILSPQVSARISEWKYYLYPMQRSQP